MGVALIIQMGSVRLLPLQKLLRPEESANSFSATFEVDPCRRLVLREGGDPKAVGSSCASPNAEPSSNPVSPSKQS